MAWLYQMLGIFNFVFGLYFALELIGSLCCKSLYYTRLGAENLLYLMGIPALLFILTGISLYFNRKFFLLCALWTFPLAYSFCNIYFFPTRIDTSWIIPALLCLVNIYITFPKNK